MSDDINAIAGFEIIGYLRKKESMTRQIRPARRPLMALLGHVGAAAAN